MIPTWSTHAREARKHVRFALGTAIVRAVRYVAHLSATFQEGHPSPAQEQPMTTLTERHEADQDDSDRYVLTSAPCMPCQRKRTAELTAEIWASSHAPSGKAKCSCGSPRDPNCDGPEQDCPEHGDVRWYSSWLAQACEEIERMRATIAERDATIERVRALVAEPGCHPRTDRIRAALDTPTQPAPDLEVTPDAPSPRLIQAGDHVYVWRESDVTDGMVRPLAHGVYAVPGVDSDARAWLNHQDQLNAADNRRAT